MKLLINAKIFPNIQSKSILIKNNKIKFIGDLDDINISFKSLDIIDCKNNSVLPGFIDSHIHLFESIVYSSKALVGQLSMHFVHVPQRSSINGSSYFKSIYDINY